MSRRSNIAKRQRQKRRHAQRPQQTGKPAARAEALTSVGADLASTVARVKTAGLFGAILARPSSRAFEEALQETQHT
jgi:hypothetical protein